MRMKLFFLFFEVLLGVVLGKSLKGKIDIGALGDLSWQQVDNKEFSVTGSEVKTRDFSNEILDHFGFQAVDTSNNNSSGNNSDNGSNLTDNSSDIGNSSNNSSNNSSDNASNLTDNSSSESMMNIGNSSNNSSANSSGNIINNGSNLTDNSSSGSLIINTLNTSNSNSPGNTTSIINTTSNASNISSSGNSSDNGSNLTINSSGWLNSSNIIDINSSINTTIGSNSTDISLLNSSNISNSSINGTDNTTISTPNQNISTNSINSSNNTISSVNYTNNETADNSTTIPNSNNMSNSTQSIKKNNSNHLKHHKISNQTNIPNNNSIIANQTDNSSIYQNPTPTYNISKLENITDNLTKILNPHKNILSDYKKYLSDLNYSSKASNISVSTLKKSIFPRIETLKSLIRSSLIVDSLNERSQLRKSLAETDAIEEVIHDIDHYNNCSMNINCTSCVVDLGCGWCPSLNLCIIGNNEGPYLGKCPFYQYGLCSGKSCARYTDCDSCLKDEQCGWCQNEEKGFAKCVEGKAFFDACPSDFWLHSQRTLDRLNSCSRKFGPSEDQLDRKEQNRIWEKNQITRFEKLKRKGREIREGLGFIPTKRQSGDYLEKAREKRKRLEVVDDLVNSFSIRKRVYTKDSKLFD